MNKTKKTSDRFQVSVIIPVFNAARYLVCAVESALQQSEVGEVVLIDDGSTDDSYAVAVSLVARYPDRVTCFWHEGHVNRGPGASRNLGLQHASRPFIAFLDADDWYLPDCFAFDRAAFAADPGLGMVRHSLGNGWNPDDEAQRWFVEYTGEKRARAAFHSRVDGVLPEDYFCSLYPIGDISSGIAGMLTIRTSLAKSVGGFPVRSWAEDVTFHLKLAAVGRVAFADMEKPMAMRRIHAENLSRTKAAVLSERIDSTGSALLDTADFVKTHGLARRMRISLHIGWLRFGRQYTQHRSFAMIVKVPGGILSLRVANGYLKHYMTILLSPLIQLCRKARWTLIRQALQVRTRFGVLPVYYWQASRGPGIGNWGDELNRDLLEALTGRRVERLDAGEARHRVHYLAVGSVLGMATPNSIVWGTGAISPIHLPAAAPRRICAVRGPLTRERLEAVGIACPAIYGDPALLFSHFYQPTKPRHGRVVVVPNYIDADLPCVLRLVEVEQALLVLPNVVRHWLDFVDDIAGASFVIASSLYGLIVAESYGVPAVWAKFSDSIVGGSFKYLDFYASIEKSDQHPIVVTSEADFSLLRTAASQWESGCFDPKPLLRACPFHLRARSVHRTTPSV